MKRSKFTSLLFMLLIVTILSASMLTGCDDDKKKVSEFYNAVMQSHTLLCEVSDDVHDYWRDAIYNDKYSGDINIAINAALDDNEDKVNLIAAMDPSIRELYKEIKDSDLSEEVKNVMYAYSDLYEFTINVSGSFKLFSESIDTKQNGLANALRNLSLEL